MQFDPITIIKAFGTLGILAVIFAESGLFFGFFLPGDSLLFSAGLLASAGYLNIWIILLLCPVAAILGDNFGYWFGRRVGPRLFTREDSFFFNKKYIEQTNAFYLKHGRKTVVFARFVPIVRTFAPILAGMGGMSYKTFFSFNVIGGVLWTSSMLVAGLFLGRIVPDIDRFILPVIGTIVILSFLTPVLIQIFRRK
jgi:membrane-associated protein